ncbi:hypothetical protein N0V94_009183, partial [Neodidymelliopsis sp. IMI 364377]
PVTQKIKELIANKAIGELLSSHFTQALGMPGDAEPAGIDYTARKEVGGSFHTIMFGHVAGTAIFALGGLEEFSSVLGTRWLETKIFHQDGTFGRMMKREVPDHIMLQGVPPIQWQIFGTKGELRVTALAHLGLGLGMEKIELFDHAKDSVEVIEFEYADAVNHLPMFANNVGGFYELFAGGGTFEQGFVNFEEAVRFHRVIEQMESSWEGKRFERVSE